MRTARESLRQLAATALCAAGASCVACIGGCDNEDDEHLWNGALSPTQVQKQDMGQGPTTIVAPEDGVSEDPFIDNPNYPYAEEPAWEEPGGAGV